MSIEIPQETADKLNRLRVLDALIEVERADDGDLVECWKLREELVAEFLPMVQLIVRSGLLTVCAEEEKGAAEEYLSPEYEFVAWDADHAFGNGNIWVQCGAVMSTSLKYSSQQKPDPSAEVTP